MVDDPSQYVDVLLVGPGEEARGAAGAEEAPVGSRTDRRRFADHRHREGRDGGDASRSCRRGTGRVLPISKRSATWRRNSNASVLFRLLEELVLWENTTNEEVLKRARDEIWQSESTPPRWPACRGRPDTHPRFIASHVVDAIRNRLALRVAGENRARAPPPAASPSSATPGPHSRRFPTSSFFLVSTEITGCPALNNPSAVASMCSNRSLRSG